MKLASASVSLLSTTVGGITSLYAYNGDGTRLKQALVGTVTTYTQDLVAPLLMILQAQMGFSRGALSLRPGHVAIGRCVK